MSPGLISTDASKASDILSTSLSSSVSSVASGSSFVASAVSSVSTVSSASVEVSSVETSSGVSSTSPFTSKSLFSSSDIFTVPPNTNQYIHLDRKSTRLNSSHVAISYAVFCLKKKKIHYMYNYQL